MPCLHENKDRTRRGRLNALKKWSGNGSSAVWLRNEPGARHCRGKGVSEDEKEEKKH